MYIFYYYIMSYGYVYCMTNESFPHLCSALFEIICENGLYWLCQIIFANQFTEGARARISFGEANINGKTLKKA